MFAWWREIRRATKRAARALTHGATRIAQAAVALSGAAARRVLGVWRRTVKQTRRAARKSKDRAVKSVRLQIKEVVERRLSPHAPVLDGDGGRGVALQIDAAAAVRERITELAQSGRPIVVGPWLSETGFELLYWIPFVRWAKAYGNIRSDRLIVVSRGGAASWYEDVSTRYVDLLTLYSPEEFRQRNDARILEHDGQKQHAPTAFEQDVFSRVTAAVEDTAEWLHPSIMYGLFKLFWMQMAPVSLVQEFTRHRRLPHAQGPLPVRLPAQYIAAKFYANASFPDTLDNRRFVASLLRRMTESNDVVLLSTGISLDDHADFDTGDQSRLHRIEGLLEPADNLRVQTRIVEDAAAYVGTYGGFSYLAPLAGTDALTFYSEAQAFRHDHLDLAHRVFEQVGGGRFIAAPPSFLPALDAVAGGWEWPSPMSAVQ